MSSGQIIVFEGYQVMKAGAGSAHRSGWSLNSLSCVDEYKLVFGLWFSDLE